MKIVRTFHPVGQGAFYSEKFQIWKPKEETHNIVYDCGVCYMKEKQAVHVVKQAFAGKDEIDYLFISHLDYDHVSLTYAILPRVKNIVLPLVSKEELIIAMMFYVVSEESGAAMLFREIINRIENDNRRNSVIFVGDLEYRSSEGGTQKVLASGTGIEPQWDYDWVLIPHNVKYHSRRQKLIDELDKLIHEKEFVKEIVGQGLKPFKTAEELIEKLNERDFAGKVLVMPNLRKTIRRAYASIEGGTNENSLLLYSGPKRGVIRYVIEFCMPERPWGDCWIAQAACLYTGDSICDMADWKKKYSAVWDHVGTIQLPHHGSVESFDVDSYPIDRQYIFPVSFGTYNTYGHPSGRVLAYLMMCDCCIQMVTEMANSRYMQRIAKWR
jgi:hypothetical protein